MRRKYRVADAKQVAQQGAREIETWLRELKATIKVENVEADPDFQSKDIDLIWTTTRGVYTIEVKADRWDRTGNFFFETHSNRERGTPGCFLYTEADLLFYYFVETRTLYVLPMPATRVWFLPRMERFKQRSTTTPVGSTYYTTVGRLVPIREVVRGVPGVKLRRL